MHEEQYSNTKNLYKKALYAARGEYITRNVNDYKSDSKSLYRFIQKIMGDDKISTYPAIVSNQVLADEMGIYYGNKIKNIRENITSNHPNLQDMPIHPSPNLSSCFDYFRPVTNEEVLRLIKEINDKHHPDDPVPVWLIKEKPELFIPMLKSIINKSFAEGHFPESLKHGTI